MATFVFPGQGSQYKGMGKDLFEGFPEILATVDRVVGYSMSELCLADPKGLLNDTQYTQPALYVVNALTYFRAIESKGKTPDYVAGHSLGEYNALLAAGVMDFETGLRLVQKRGELMSKVRGGGMAAVVGLSDKEIARILVENSFAAIDIANRNTPSQFVISGPAGEIQKAKSALEAAGAKMVVPLRVSAPFHSRYMEEVRKDFSDFLRTISFSQPRMPVISNVEARPYAKDRIRELLSEQITSPVHWTETIQYLTALGESDFVEVGPGSVLTGLIKKIHQETEPSELQQPAGRVQNDPSPGPDPMTDGHPAYRRAGVYVVIGGAGGIGMVWSEYVIRHYAAQVIWIGRRALNGEIQANLERLGKIGPRPRYIPADATDRVALQSAYEEIKRDFPRINGLVHAAIVLRDQSLARMDEDVFRAGLSAKVDVSVRMAQVFGAERLDFVLFFSSITSFAKRAGQSNYSSGSTFKDAFAQKLSQDWPCLVRVMNWGYWGSVGITASDAYRERMAQQGIGSIESTEGMQALETLWNNPVPQLVTIEMTKPLSMPGMNLSEALDDSTEAVPSLIETVIKENEQRDSPASQGLSAALLDRRKQMDKLLHKLLWVQLQEMPKANEKAWASGDWFTGLGVASGYAAWLEESIDALSRLGLVRRNGTEIELLAGASLTSDTAWQQWENLKAGWPDQDDAGYFTLVETTLRALPDILSGNRQATDVIFPHSSMELVAAVYKRNRIADYFSDVLANAVTAYLEARVQKDSGARLRILEIGAGTGGTTATILKRLAPFKEHIADYCYTDISKAFLFHGERMYGANNPFMTFRSFNVELEPEEQGLSLDRYDLIIAANVLHATARIRPALRHAKALLHKNGLLFLNELGERALFSHLTFGLLKGWWLYQDPLLRMKGTPALSPETWKRVLEDEGFQSVAFATPGLHDFGLQIIVAESDGLIRRRLQDTRSMLPQEAVKPNPPKSVPIPTIEPEVPAIAAPRPPVDGLHEKTRGYLKRVIGETLKIPAHKIAASEPLENYGIDSVKIIEITSALQKDLGDIDSTLFFEHQTVDAVASHFLSSRHDALANLLGEEQKSELRQDSSTEKATSSTILFGTKLRAARAPASGKDRGEGRSDISQTINPSEPIAIVGIAGRYPDAESVSEFWDVLKQGKSCIREIPADRWPWERYFDPERGKMWTTYTKWGGFLKDADKFDPLFFQISPVEAQRMDPQERLFLEIAYASIEDAGYTPKLLSKSRKIGVFVGVMNSTYKPQSAHWSIANRVSYVLDFQGPSLAVDTACSSSLTAIHLAVESLRSGTSECAIAGGVNLILDPVHYVGLSVPRLLTDSEKCKPFGDQADGFVDGEGVGAVVLKPLGKAVADGDHIYGVIKGTAINAGGRTNGYTVPNPTAQSQLIIDALQNAAVHPRTISYIEAQATGTMLGDPIEITGLKRAFEQQTDDKGFCAIGSVKSNIGHSESASGIAGVTKVLLQLKHAELVPSINAETLNPRIRFENTPFVVQRDVAAWVRPTVTLNGESREYPRIAGISSFGAGGANAHVLIEEFIDDRRPARRAEQSNDPSTLILLSARNEGALQRAGERLLAFLRKGKRENSVPDLAALAFTLQVGRVAMEERLAIVVQSVVELEEKLERWVASPGELEGVYRARAKRNTGAASLFVGDEELEEAIDKWLQKGKQSKLMEVWLLGLDVDWARMYKGGSPRRVSLPTYPFERERYWLEEFERKGVMPAAGPTAAIVEEKAVFSSDAHASLEDYVRNTIADRLRAALALENHRFDFDDSFADVGLDSITGNQLVKEMNQTLKIELNVSRLFDYTSINRLTAYILSEHRDELSGSPEHSNQPSATEVLVPSGDPLSQSAVPRTEKANTMPAGNKRGGGGQREPIAIIGMSGRFPKSRSLDELWSNLAAGNDLIGQVTRWDLGAHYAAESLPDDPSSLCGGLLEDIDQFDPMFFNISAIEATYMDPQQRLFLQESWRAMEDAGYVGEGVDGLSCGVYVGCCGGDYFSLFEGSIPAQAFWGIASSILPARIAYFMNLQGPAIPVDTACSSSLVAIHLACQGLWAGETEMALAGGVYVQSTPAYYILSTRAGMLSPTGRCHTFDQSADGFVMGEGVAAVVLKRLSDAIADGDHIYGVIRGSGINQDGKTNGIIAPSAKSQERLERQVYDSFHVHPEDIQMIEAHGTGTKIGDPIEVEALTRAFRKDTDKKGYCAIGSIKTNLGHTTMAAGVAGVLRVLLSLKHKQIPPSLNYVNRNESISFDESPFYVNTRLQDWKVAPGKARCAAVSSFGFSGTNAHLVLEEAPAIERHHEIKPAYLFVLSARTGQQLQQQADQLREYCSTNSDIDGGNMSFTLFMGRKHLNHRLAVIAGDVAELTHALGEWSTTGKSSKVRVSDIGVKDRQDLSSLRRYGNECIGKARDARDLRQLTEHLGVVAELFLQGCALDYRELFATGGYARVALPTYPFSRERYWIQSSAASVKQVESIVHRQKTFESSSLGGNSRVTRESGSTNRDSGVTLKNETPVGRVTLLPVWDLVADQRAERRTRPGASTTERIAVIGAADAGPSAIGAFLPGASFLAVSPGDSVEKIQSLLDDHGPVSHLFWIVPKTSDVSMFDEAIIEQQGEMLRSCFRLIKALLALGYGNRDLTWTVVTRNSQSVLEGEDLCPAQSGLHGLIGSMAQEYLNWHVRLVDLEDGDVLPLEEIFQLPTDPRGAASARRGNQWYRRSLLPCRFAREPQFSYRSGGVYVVIGGAGGLGEIWTESIIRQCNVQIVWIGRRALDSEISRKVARLAAIGNAPTYISADASNPNDMTRAYAEIKKRHVAIHGVVLSTVGALDQSLAEMTEERFGQGLSAKVDTSVQIARTFREEPLDFVLFFSSIESFATSPGKASYTSGCAFVDAYASQLSRELPSDVKVMNWGFWGNVGAGATIPETVRNRLARSGMGVIEPDEAMTALSTLLGGPCRQLVFMKITKAIGVELLGSSDSIVIEEDDRLVRLKHAALPQLVPAPAARGAVDNRTVETTAGALRNVISRVTQVAPENLEMQLTWTELGLDSILAMQVVQEVESEFGLRLYPNELIEHDTLQKLSAFLVDELRNRKDTQQPKSAVTQEARLPAPAAERAEVRKSQTTSSKKPLLFIFSTPRAGSTLLRVMLAGHHQVFSPPELHLLPFSDFGERTAVLKAKNQQFLEEGLVKAVCELKGITAAEAKAITASWTSENTPVKEVYRQLQALCPTQLLVDKSPSYASDLSILRKAEGLDTKPFYIHLVRHPLAVMESFVRNRFDRLLSIKEEPWLFAAQLWQAYNENIEKFLLDIPPDRWMRIRYEDLVAQPLAVSKELFLRLGLDFDARVLHPYEGDRMTKGLHGVSLPVADPNFNNHDKIEADLAAVWEEHLDKTPLLSFDAVRLAQRYGYRFVKDARHKLLPAQESFLSRFGENPVWSIDQFVRLELDTTLDITRLRACLQHLVAKHASLRSYFQFENGAWFEEEGDTYSVPVLYVNGSGLEKGPLDKSIMALQNDLHLCVDGRTRVNLACGVVDYGGGDYQLILVAHHLAVDGVSVYRLRVELVERYGSPDAVSSSPAPDERVHAYRDELERKLTPEVLDQHRRFWQRHIDATRYRLSRRGSQPNELPGEMASESEYTLRLPMSALNWPASRSKIEFFGYLSAALYRTISASTGLTDVVVAHRLHRRNIGSDQDFSEVLGWFAGDVPLKISVNPGSPLSETAADFRAQFASIPMGGVSYEVLSNLGAVPACHDVCPIRLNYFPAYSVRDGVEVGFEKFQAPGQQRLYVLDLIVAPGKADCLFIARYPNQYFSQSEISEMVDGVAQVLQSDEGVVLTKSATPATDVR